MMSRSACRVASVMVIAATFAIVGCDQSGELTPVQKRRLELETRRKISGYWLCVESDKSAPGGKQPWLWKFHYSSLERTGIFERFKLTEMPKEDEEKPADLYEWEEKYAGHWEVDAYTLLFEPTEYLNPNGVYLDMSHMPESTARERFQKPWKALNEIDRDVKESPNKGTMVLILGDDEELEFTKLMDPKKEEDGKSESG